MYLKNKLMKAAAVCSYVFTGLWMVAAACCFALSNPLYWLCVVFALITLVNGFVITDIRHKMKSVRLEKKEQSRYLACLILSVLCLPAFILNCVAYFRTQEDELVVVRKNVQDAPVKTKAEKPLPRSARFITICIALVLVFLFSFGAHCIETSGFKVTVNDFTLTKAMTEQYNGGEINGKTFVMPNDTTYAVTMYVPATATEQQPAPVVFVLPGFTRTKATMSQYCIELSRRGFVVFCSDPGGQGSTTETSTTGANGVEYLVQYVYNNTDDFKFCDKTRFGAVGHSAGGGNVCTLAADMAGKSFEESVIKAVYISGYIKVSSANKYANLRCNAALSYAYYDEGSFRYQTDTSSFEVISRRFINEVNGKNNGYDAVAIDYGYGDMSNGTYRIVHREDINHCFEMYDPVSIANTVEFFGETLGAETSLSPRQQVWFGKELLNGLSLAAAFTFILSLCAVLMKLPFFARMKESQKAVTEVPVLQEHQTISHKVIFWFCMILTAVIACLDYIPLAHLSIQIFPTGNSASVFTYVFPARMINAILLWAAINGAIGLIIFFGTTLLEYVYEKAAAKAHGQEMEPFDWGKFKAIRICQGKGSGVLANTGKALLLSVIMFAAFYLLVHACYRLFHQDFRFMLVSAAPINARMFVTAWEYIPIIFIFYISNSIRVNCSIGREGWSEWKTLLVGALANSIGLMFILLINYVCYFSKGVPFYGYWGSGTEVWLYINMVFALVVMMFLLPIFNRIFYKLTGNVWTGALACCMIFIMMTISASVSYIPMY